ncbi:hypothetical protein M8C21_004500, partial [Ambrosia artemisiifolia]
GNDDEYLSSCLSESVVEIYLILAGGNKDEIVLGLAMALLGCVIARTILRLLVNWRLPVFDPSALVTSLTTDGLGCNNENMFCWMLEARGLFDE